MPLHSFPFFLCLLLLICTYHSIVTGRVLYPHYLVRRQVSSYYVSTDSVSVSFYSWYNPYPDPASIESDETIPTTTTSLPSDQSSPTTTTSSSTSPPWSGLYASTNGGQTANINSTTNCIYSYFCDGDVIALILYRNYLSRCAGCAPKIGPWIISNFTANFTFSFPPTFNDIPMWSTTDIPGRSESWAVEYVSNNQIRLRAETGRYLMAVPATDPNSTVQGYLTNYHVAYLNVDADSTFPGTVFNVDSYSNDGGFKLLSALGGEIFNYESGLQASVPTVYDTATLPMVGDWMGAHFQVEDFYLLPYILPKLVYTAPVLPDGSIAPYTHGQVYQFLSANNFYGSLQWSGLHMAVNSSAWILALTNFTQDLVNIMTPYAYSYHEMFRVLVYENGTDGLIQLQTLDGWNLLAGQDNALLPLVDVPSSQSNGSIFSVTAFSENDVYSLNWGDQFQLVTFNPISPADVTQATNDLANDQIMWSSQPTEENLKNMTSSDGYQTAIQLWGSTPNISGIYLILNNQSQSVLQTYSGDVLLWVNIDLNTAISNFSSKISWTATFEPIQVDADLSALSMQFYGTGNILAPLHTGLTRQLPRYNLTNLQPSVSPTYVDGDMPSQSWLLSVTGNGTNYNGTGLDWYSVTLQHSWWLGWYLGVCDVGDKWIVYSGALPPMAVAMETNASDPRVQWTMLVGNS